jgi:hypothetical protein
MSLRLSFSRMIAPAVVLHLTGLGLLAAQPAGAQPPATPEATRLSPCAEGPALLAGRLAYLQARIGLQPDQMPAWDAFAAAMRSAAGPMDALCAATDGHPRFDPDPLKRLETAQRGAEALEKTLAATRDALAALLPSLTTAQREVVASAFAPPPPPPPGGPHGGPGGHGFPGERGHGFGPGMPPLPPGMPGPFGRLGGMPPVAPAAFQPDDRPDAGPGPDAAR